MSHQSSASLEDLNQQESASLEDLSQQERQRSLDQTKPQCSLERTEGDLVHVQDDDRIEHNRANECVLLTYRQDNACKLTILQPSN